MADQDFIANARLAYQEVCKSYQSIVDFRIKLLGFLPLASGTGAYAILSQDQIPNWAWVAGVFGFLITLGLFLYELRGLQRAAALERAGRELEAQLGLSSGQFQETPDAALHGLVDPRGAAWIIFPTVQGSWLYLVGVQRLGTLWAAVAAALLAAAFAFWMIRRQSSLPASSSPGPTPVTSG